MNQVLNNNNLQLLSIIKGFQKSLVVQVGEKMVNLKIYSKWAWKEQGKEQDQVQT